MKISIDCWGTLLKGSPTFSQKKIELVKKHFPSLNDDFILQCFSETKKTLNDVIENSGGCQPKTEHIFSYLISKLNGGYTIYHNLEQFISEYQQLAIKEHPELYSDETGEYISELSVDYLLVLSCNTMLITGETLRACLNKMGIGAFFYQFTFSDKNKFAKPHWSMYSGSQYHIGDNPITDGIGAKNAGSTPIIINSTHLTIRDAYHIIIQGR